MRFRRISFIRFSRVSGSPWTGIYFAGGHTTLNGVRSDNEQRNTRAGFTLALPVDRQNSLKLSASTGLSTRTGSEFTAVGIAWQYRLGRRVLRYGRQADHSPSGAVGRLSSPTDFGLPDIRFNDLDQRFPGGVR